MQSIRGIPLENQGGDASSGHHWEARYMFGDYMISTNYIESVISDISFDLFADSGFIKSIIILVAFLNFCLVAWYDPANYPNGYHFSKSCKIGILGNYYGEKIGNNSFCFISKFLYLYLFIWL